MVCVATPAGVCNVSATPPPANVTSAFTCPDALVADALVADALVVFALVFALGPAPVPDGLDPLKSMTAEFELALPLPATWVTCETPLTETFWPPVALACGLAPALAGAVAESAVADAGGALPLLLPATAALAPALAFTLTPTLPFALPFPLPLP